MFFQKQKVYFFFQKQKCVFSPRTLELYVIFDGTYFLNREPGKIYGRMPKN